MNTDVIQLVGSVTDSGPVSMILVGVHGNELCGVEAVDALLPSLAIESGKVFIVRGNPKAIEQRVRYTEANLNRLFRPESDLSPKEKASYEYIRAQFLKTYLHQADVLLDIHASSIPNSKRFVICEKNAQDVVEYLPIDLVVSGFDGIEPGGTDYYMNSIGKVGICVECGYLEDPHSTEVAKECIGAFLKARGHIAHDFTPHAQSYVHMYEKYYAQTDHFVLAKTFENFEAVDANQVIGVDGDKEIRATKPGIILFAHNGSAVHDEVFLLGEATENLV